MRLEDWYRYVEQLEKGQQNTAAEKQPAPSAPEQAGQTSAPGLTAEAPAQAPSPEKPDDRPSAREPRVTGSLFETEEVLARPLPPPEVPRARAVETPAAPIEPADLDIPEIEDFLPFLKDRGGNDAPGPGPSTPAASRPESQAGVRAVPPPPASAEQTAARKNGGEPPKRAAVEPVTPAPAASVPPGSVRQEAPAPAAPAAQPPAQPAGTEPPQTPQERTEAPARPAAKASGTPPAAVSEAARAHRPPAPPAPDADARADDAAEDGEQAAGPVWNRLPAHLQAFASMQVEEVAQRSYKRGFRESRQELLARLLDPPLSLEEAARILNVCPTTVRRYTNRGLLPHFRTAGNQRRFRFSDIVAFMESQQNAGRRKSARGTGEEPESAEG